MTVAAQPANVSSPFALQQPDAYLAWREAKLAARGIPPVVEIARPGALRQDELRRLVRTVQQRNFALFRATAEMTDIVDELQRFGRQLGLIDLDQNLCAEDSGLTAITVKPTATEHTYIPYTNRPLGWHTDGYYNDQSHQVRAWLLFCVHPAVEGGTNALMDHEIAYIRLRDENPDWIRALMANDAFTIPGNVEYGEQIRADHPGPVFSIDNAGQLHMRYSARQRNIVWKDDAATRDAAGFLLDLFKRGDDHILQFRLRAGEGIISNNVLHRRAGFRDPEDAPTRRLLYRGRYYQRLPGMKEALIR